MTLQRDRRARVTGWGRATSAWSVMARPADDTEWQRLVADAGPRGLIPRGAGCAYGDAAQNSGGVVAMTTAGAVAGPVDPDTGTVTADAGATLGDLMRVLVPAGWTLPVLPGTARVTVGGAIAADVHGKNHRTAGTFGAHVAGMTLLTPGQGLITIDPRDRPREFWATVGGLGLTGVIRQARLRVEPLATAWMLGHDRAAADLADALSMLAGDQEPGTHAVAWIDAHQRGGRLGAGIVTRTWPAKPHHLPSHLRDRARAYRPQRPAPLPRLPGRGVLTPATVRAANRLRLATARRDRGPGLRPLAAALHPLDAASGWPGLYGGRGLVQYQLVVPEGAEDVLAAALEMPQAAGHPATLAVLKAFGPAGPAPLSFPRSGWSLALDFPAAAAALAAVLDALDERVAAAGGRVYLVKDSRLRPEMVEAMYPDLATWRAVRDELDPHGHLASDLARRLRLTGVGERPDA